MTLDNLSPAQKSQFTDAELVLLKADWEVEDLVLVEEIMQKSPRFASPEEDGSPLGLAAAADSPPLTNAAKERNARFITQNPLLGVIIEIKRAQLRQH